MTPSAEGSRFQVRTSGSNSLANAATMAMRPFTSASLHSHSRERGTNPRLHAAPDRRGPRETRGPALPSLKSKHHLLAHPHRFHCGPRLFAEQSSRNVLIQKSERHGNRMRHLHRWRRKPGDRRQLIQISASRSGFRRQEYIFRRTFQPSEHRHGSAPLPGRRPGSIRYRRTPGTCHS